MRHATVRRRTDPSGHRLPGVPSEARSGRLESRLASLPATTLGALVAGLLLLTATSACTSGSSGDAAPRPTPTATAPTPTVRARPSAPMRVLVTHVAGTLAPRSRVALARDVGRTLSSYADRAFLRVPYPHAGLSHAFGAFTRRVRPQARRDRRLLTDVALARSTRGVRATHRTAYLSVLAPHGSAAGVTAAVDLVLLVDRGDRPGRRVHLAGRMLMTRTPTGRWAVFGYDLHRSERPLPAAAGSRS